MQFDEKGFADNFRRFVPEERIDRLEFASHDGATQVTAAVTVNRHIPYDGQGLLLSIGGSVVDANDYRIIIDGQFRGDPCRLTITTAARIPADVIVADR
jgi:hypothetical protein